MSAASPEKDTVLPSTETDGTPPAEEKTVIPEEQWRSIKSVLEALLNYRDETGHDPSKVFHKRVNKRFVPDYYDVIQEPMAFSNLKAKLATLEYTSFAEFVRDCALIWHNAHTYNRPDAGAYQDASTMKVLMEKEFKRLVDDGAILAGDVEWPDLGEIPPVEDLPPGEEGEEDDEDDEDEDDEEAEDTEEEVPKKRKRGRPPLSANKRRDTMPSEGDKPDMKKKRGRPPKVDTPMEARIKNVLKGIRRVKNDDGSLIHSFEKLPEKSAMPEYYQTIKQPMSVDQIKKSLKRKRYQSLDAFMTHIDLMFDNAKLYNEDDSQIYLDALALQTEAHRLADIERQKDDTEFVLEEGRKPKPDGIMHKGEMWRVGDWVHITNANDMTKPIVAQIYRTYEDSDGQEWVNACWYYRPEQTVHHYEKHFYPDEVVKTGQYRDHPIDDVIERCFVMFFTRYPKGRPRGAPSDLKVYVCEARYNEERHKMNKIKTWASCLPDEVRDKDYEMDMFPAPRKVKKVPSPLVYMLEEEGKVTEEAPPPKWGMENAPPIVGGIYKGLKDENQSPPPEPTPSPPPQPPPQPARQSISAAPREDSFGKAEDLFKRATMAFADQGLQRRGSEQPPQQVLTPQPHKFPHNIGTPTPSHHTNHTPLQPHPHDPQAQQHYPTQYTPSYMDPQHRASPQSQRYTQPQHATPRYPVAPPGVPGGPRQADAFVLTDTENAKIPEEIRDQFHHDDNGRVMFFTKPPAEVLPPPHANSLAGHTVQYQAAKILREEALREKRKQREEETHEKAAKKGRLQGAENGALQNGDVAMTNGVSEKSPAQGIEGEAWKAFVKHMQDGTDELLENIQGAGWKQARELNIEKLGTLQHVARQHALRIAESEAVRLERTANEKRLLFEGPKVFLDDTDPRLAR